MLTANVARPSSKRSSFGWQGVPWQIWIVAVALTVEGLFNAYGIPKRPEAIAWLAAKCVIIPGLLLGSSWIAGLFLLLAGFHVLAFLTAAPIVSLINLGMIVALLRVRPFSLSRWYGPPPAKPKLAGSRRVRVIATGIPILLGAIAMLGLANKSQFCSGWAEHYSQEAAQLRKEATLPENSPEETKELFAAADVKELAAAKWNAVGMAPWRPYPTAPLVSPFEINEILSKYR